MLPPENTVHELPVRLTSLYIRIPKTPRTEPGKNDLHYCQRTTASGDCRLRPAGGRMESVWKHDIRLGCRALRLKATQAHPIGNVQLGKLGVLVSGIKAGPISLLFRLPQWQLHTVWLVRIYDSSVVSKN